MRAVIVDERDVSRTIRDPVFRVTFWFADDNGYLNAATTFDLINAQIWQVLDFAQSEEFMNAKKIEIFSKFETQLEGLSANLLGTIDP